MNKWFKIVISLLICYLAAAIGSFATSKGVSDWYVAIKKPEFNPPNWVFAPVWGLLYTLMGVSFGIFWHKSKTLLNQGGLWFFFQLLLNISWSFFFFSFNNITYALIVIFLLVVSISFCIYFFSKQTKLASFILLPYFFWVGFASILNLAIWLLNR